MTQKPLAALGNTYYAIQSDGALMAWGDGFHGAICAEEDLSSFSQANRILENAVFATGNMNLGLAIDREQTLWGWGWDWTGRLLGSNDAEKTPIRLLDHAVEAAAGLHHCLALKADGTLWAWGSNQYGQLGTGEQEESGNRPPIHPLTQVMSHVRGIATDRMFASFAVKEDGTVWAWGKQNNGDAVWDSPRPIMDHAQAVQWLWSDDRGSILLLGTDGNLWRSDFDDAQGCYTQPEKFLKQVAAFTDHCAVTVNHALWTWGLPAKAGPNFPDACVPVYVMGDVQYADADAGCTLAIRTDGTLWGVRNTLPEEPEKSAIPSSLEPFQLGESMMVPERQFSLETDGGLPNLIDWKPEDSAAPAQGGDNKPARQDMGDGSFFADKRAGWGVALAFGAALLPCVLILLRKKR